MFANALPAEPERVTASRSASLIEITGLSKTYQSKDGPVEALRNIDLRVAEGEFVALVGPSGCGKSTLLHIVAGLVDFEAGEVSVAGSEAHSGRKDTGIMLQKPVLLPWRSVLSNVLLPIEILKLDPKQYRSRAQELLEVVGIGEFADKYPWELSGGMRQRASLAQALVADPRLLLMDEPFSAVDEFTREKLNFEVAGLHDKLDRTTLFVTHNILESVFLADRVVAMKPRPGEIVETVKIELPRPRQLDLLDDPRTLQYVAQIRHSLALTGGS